MNFAKQIIDWPLNSCFIIANGFNFFPVSMFELEITWKYNKAMSNWNWISWYSGWLGKF